MTDFQAGAARVVITPPLWVPLSGYFYAEGRQETARDVHDDLYARALVLNDGQQLVALVTLDLIAIGAEELQAVRDVVQRETGITPEQLIVSCTHTHSGPVVQPFLPTNIVPGQADADYHRLLPRLIASAVTMAQRRQRPARIGAGRGACAININRREFLPDGTLRGLPFLGQNPQGPVDREVGVFRVDDATTGAALAVFLSYACHPVILGPNLEISRDFVGGTLNFLERSLGGEVVALYANGAQGNMNPLIHPGSYADAERLGTILGSEALQVVLQIKTTADALRIVITRRVAELPLNPDSEPDRQRAYIAFLELERQRAQQANERARAWDLEMRLDVAGYRLHTREHISGPTLSAEVSAVGISGPGLSLGLVSEPAELFCEYGQQARAQSPFETTLVLGLANGAIGYVPTPEVYTEGGYESEATNVAPEAGAQLCQTMIEALRACDQALRGTPTAEATPVARGTIS